MLKLRPLSRSTGDNNGVRPDELPPVPRKVEHGGEDDEQPVRGVGPRQMPADPLRAARPAAEARDGEDAEVPGHPVGRDRFASREAHQQTRRGLSLQVRNTF